MHPEINPNLFKSKGSDDESSSRGRDNDGSGNGETITKGITQKQKRVNRFWNLIFEQAAIVGGDWRHKTQKELFFQWQAKIIYDWHHTTHLTIIHTDQKKNPYHEVHPYLKAPEVKKVAATTKKSLFRHKLRG